MELKEDRNLYVGNTYEVVTAVRYRGEDVSPEDVDSLTVYHVRPDGSREIRSLAESEIVDGTFRTVFTLAEPGTHEFASDFTHDGARKGVQHKSVTVKVLKNGD